MADEKKPKKDSNDMEDEKQQQQNSNDAWSLDDIRLKQTLMK